MSHWWVDVSPHLISDGLSPVQVIGPGGDMLTAHVMLCRRCWEVQIHTLYQELFKVSIVNRGQPNDVCAEREED